MAEPSDVVHQVRDSGAFRMLQPSRYGGGAVAADEFVSSVGALGALGGSAGWLCAMFNSAAYQVAGLSDGACDEVWGDDAAALVTAGYHPSGLLAVDGPGRRLTGRWHAVAGAELAEWLLLAADADGARCWVLVPRREVRIEPVAARAGLPAAGVRDVCVSELPVAGSRVFPAGSGAPSGVSVPVLAGAAAAAAVTGAAAGLWRAHVDLVRERLATSYASEEIGDQTASTRQVARAAADIDAATLQVIASLAQRPQEAAWGQRQAVSRARDAADHLLASSRHHALHASDPVARFWQDVHTGCRLTMHLLDELDG